MVRLRVGLESPADLEAIHVGHHHVEQHDIAFRALADRQSLRPAGGGHDVKILGRQARLEQLHIGRNVINDKNAGGHIVPQAGPRK